MSPLGDSARSASSSGAQLHPLVRRRGIAARRRSAPRRAPPPTPSRRDPDSGTRAVGVDDDHASPRCRAALSSASAAAGARAARISCSPRNSSAIRNEASGDQWHTVGACRLVHVEALLFAATPGDRRPRRGRRSTRRRLSIAAYTSACRAGSSCACPEPHQYTFGIGSRTHTTFSVPGHRDPVRDVGDVADDPLAVDVIARHHLAGFGPAPIEHVP